MHHIAMGIHAFSRGVGKRGIKFSHISVNGYGWTYLVLTRHTKF